MGSENITIEGEYTTAEIKTTNVDEACTDQVEEIVNHEAFRNPVKVMPDAHYGSGAVIGFTMKLGRRIVPNTVGVDIGCGMTAYNLGQSKSVTNMLENEPESVDEGIRENIPLGRKTFADTETGQEFHIVNDFPWGVCREKAETLNENLDRLTVDTEFDGDYFKSLCERVQYDSMRAINSLGTLGSGNHFLEISKSDSTGDYWVVVHSGSRGIGHAIAEYWQEQAHRNCDSRAAYVREELSSVPEWAYKPNLDETSDEDLIQWVLGGMGEDWKDGDAIRENLSGEEIEEMFETLKNIAHHVRDNGDGNPLDYLDGDNRAGYLKDMVFAQTYAEVSRELMCGAAARVFTVGPKDSIVSTHNYIDFEDMVIRKGATRVHEGERGIIPFTSSDGSIIVEGKGNEDWNKSAPHGAGRRGSRRWAYDTFSLEEYQQEMEGVYSSSVTEDTIDEMPSAYKDPDTVLDRIEETADVVDTLTPVLNVKAEN